MCAWHPYVNTVVSCLGSVQPQGGEKGFFFVGGTFFYTEAQLASWLRIFAMLLALSVTIPTTTAFRLSRTFFMQSPMTAAK
jgi:hypothetical protein